MLVEHRVQTGDGVFLLNERIVGNFLLQLREKIEPDCQNRQQQRDKIRNQQLEQHAAFVKQNNQLLYTN